MPPLSYMQTKFQRQQKTLVFWTLRRKDLVIKVPTVTALFQDLCTWVVTSYPVEALAASQLQEEMWCFPGGSAVKASASNAGDLGLIPGSGRSPGGGDGNPLQYSCLENSMDRGTWWATVHGVTKSWTRLKWLSMHTEGPERHHAKWTKSARQRQIVHDLTYKWSLK